MTSRVHEEAKETASRRACLTRNDLHIEEKDIPAAIALPIDEFDGKTVSVNAKALGVQRLF